MPAAFASFGLATLLPLLLGLIYGLARTFMPYHADALGMAWQELTPRLQILMRAFLNGAGAGAFTTGLAMAILLMIPFRRGDPWARWALLIIGLSGYLPLLGIIWYISSNTPARPPWEFVACGTVFLLVGFTLSAERPTKSQ